MPFMYILECSDGTFYVGSTWSITNRLKEHEQGDGSHYTSKRLPVKLVYTEEFERIDEAFKREKQVQNWGSAKKKALVEGDMASLKEKAKKRF